MKQIQGLLDRNSPRSSREIASGTDVFAAYSGRKPDGPAVRSFCADIGTRLSGNPANHRPPDGLEWQTCSAPTPPCPTSAGPAAATATPSTC